MAASLLDAKMTNLTLKAPLTYSRKPCQTLGVDFELLEPFRSEELIDFLPRAIERLDGVIRKYKPVRFLRLPAKPTERFSMSECQKGPVSIRATITKWPITGAEPEMGGNPLDKPFHRIRLDVAFIA